MELCVVGICFSLISTISLCFARTLAAELLLEENTRVIHFYLMRTSGLNSILRSH